MARTEEEQRRSSAAAESAINETRKRMEKAGFSILKIAKELKLIAFSDIADHCTIDEGGALQMIPLDVLGKKSRAIKKVKENTKITESKDGETLFKDSRVEYELYDKLEALKFAAVLMGMKQADKDSFKGEVTINLVQWADGRNNPS
jgi:hypothetical protein